MSRLFAALFAALLALGVARISWGEEPARGSGPQDDFVRVVCERVDVEDQRRGILYVMDQAQSHGIPGSVILERWQSEDFYQIPFNQSIHEATLDGLSQDQKAHLVNDLVDGAETSLVKVNFLLSSVQIERYQLRITYDTNSRNTETGVNTIFSDQERSLLVATGRLICEIMLMNASTGKIVAVSPWWERDYR